MFHAVHSLNDLGPVSCLRLLGLLSLHEEVRKEGGVGAHSGSRLQDLGMPTSRFLPWGRCGLSLSSLLSGTCLGSSRSCGLHVSPSLCNKFHFACLSVGALNDPEPGDYLVIYAPPRASWPSRRLEFRENSAALPLRCLSFSPVRPVFSSEVCVCRQCCYPRRMNGNVERYRIVFLLLCQNTAASPFW